MKKTHINATGSLLASVRQTLLLAVLLLNLGTANGNNTGITGLPESTRNSTAATLRHFTLNSTVSKWLGGASVSPAPAVPLSSNPTLIFSSTSGLTDNVASDGEAGSTDISDINIEIYDISDVAGTKINTLTWRDNNFLWSSDGTYSGLTTEFNPASPLPDQSGSKGTLIKSADGSEFKLISFKYYNWGESTPFTNTIKGYRNSTEVASTTFNGFDGNYDPITVTLPATFENVDEVRIYISAGGYVGNQTLTNHSINNIKLGPAVAAAAPPTLQAGDMVVLGISFPSQRVTFATLVDIPAGTVIKITDRGWDQATNAFTPSMTADGIVTWTTTSAISAGTVFTLTLGGSDNTPTNNLTNVTAGNVNLTSQITVSAYTISNVITIGGEQIFIYQGDDTNPYFIFGLNASRNTNLNASYWQTLITAPLNESMIPNGTGSQNALTNGTNAVGILTNLGGGNPAQEQFDNVFYNGPTTGTDRAGWLSRITTAANWSGDDSGAGSTSIGITNGSAVNLSAAVNTPPAASAVSMTGTLAVGQTLTGTYTYSDAESNPQSGSTFKWYRSNDAAGAGKTAIPSATAITYTLVAADAGKYISFEVTPRDGTDFGTAVESDRLSVHSPVSTLSFDGIRQYVNVPNRPALEFTAGTIEMWVKPGWDVRGSITDPNPTLISMRDAAGARFSIHMGGTYDRIGLYSNVGGWQQIPYSFQKDKWYHIAFALTTSSTKVYINGVLIGNVTSYIASAFTGKNLKIGASIVGNQEYFKGEIDEIRIWNVERSASMIRQNMGTSFPASTSNLIAYYPIDAGVIGAGNESERSLTEKTDDALNGYLYNYWVPIVETAAATSVSENEAVLGGEVKSQEDPSTERGIVWATTPNPTTTDNKVAIGTGTGSFSQTVGLPSGYILYVRSYAINSAGTAYGNEESFTTPDANPPGHALHFDGVNDQVTAPSIPQISFSGSSDFSLEAWVKPENVAQEQTVIVKSATAGQLQYWLFIGTDKTISFGLDKQSTNWGWYKSSISIPALEWSHIAVTKTGNNIQLYINGSPVATNFSGTTDYLTALQSTGPLQIGNFGSYIYKGGIDEVRIWNTTRTAGQIASNWLDTVDPADSDLAAYYRFDQGIASGTNTAINKLFDQTALSNHGTLNNFSLTGTSSNWIISNAMVAPVSPDANGVLYVKKGGAGNQTGDSWANAVGELADALKAAAATPAIEEIWVSGGTYKPMYSPRDGANFADEGRDNAFLLVKDVKVYGGFAGTEGTLEERDLSLTANTSILSGDFNDNDAVSGSGATLNIANNSDNAHHVVISAGDAGTAVLNGFTIKGGNANESGQFIVNGTIIERNAGGGLRTSTSAASFANLLIVNNYGEYGGGIASTYNSQANYTNIVVGNNSALGGGGIYVNGTSDITLTNSSIAGNKGGPGFLIDSSSPTVQNSIVWGNSDGGIIGGNPHVSHSIVQEVWAGTGNLNANPLFIDVENGNYTLSATSPALNAGDNILFSGLGANTKDLAGNDRVYQFGSGGEIDMGAYEFQGDAIAAVMSVSVPPDGTYGINDILEFTVTFSQAVTVDITGSTPYISLVIGTDNVQAEYVSGSGTNTLTFRYTVQPGDQAPSGISLGATIEGGDLGTAEPDLNGVPATAGILIDGGTVPQITSTPTLTIPYGQPYEYSITATGNEALPTTLTAEVLPDWLDFSMGGASEVTAFGNIPAEKQISGVAGDIHGNVYAITYDGTEIYKIAPDGSTSLWKLGLMPGIVYALHIADGYIYIPRYGNHTRSITRVPLDDPSAPEEVFVSESGGIMSLTDRGEWIYGTNFANSRIIRVHKVTKVKETVVSGLGFYPPDLTFGSDDLLYIATYNYQSIVRYDGSSVTDVLTELPSAVTSVRQDAQGYFYISMAGGGVRKYTADFSSYVTVSALETDFIWSLSLTPGGGLVYARMQTNQIYRLQTGAILSGTPDKSHLGDHPVTIRATNAIGHTDQTFTITVVDGTAPVISSSSPADEATGIDLQPTLSLTFDEEVVLSTTGTLKLMDGATVLRSYDLSIPAEKAAFALSGDQKTLSWTVDADLPLNTLVAVEISAGFVKDLAGNDFAGMTAASGEWNFTTLNITPDANGILYVKKGGAGNQTGDSWANAIAEMADALKAAASIPAIEKIWVAGGTYKPMYSPRDGANFADEDRDNTFLLVKDIKVYGGFAGTESDLEDRAPELIHTTHASILSGDIDAVAGKSGNDARHVVVSAGDVGAAVLDGFTVMGGYSVGSNGSIMVNGVSSVSRTDGAGIYLRTSSPVLTNLIIHGNTANSSGGGLANAAGSSPTLDRVIIRNNEAGGAHGGGAVNFDNTAPVFRNVLIADNIAGSQGGGLYNGNTSAPKLLNTTLTGNTAATGAGMSNVGTVVTVTNSIIWNNKLSNNTIQNVLNSTSTVTYSYSLVQGSSAGWASFGTDGGNNKDADPLFTDPDLGDYSLSDGSPAIVAGSNAAYIAGGGDPENDLDLAGLPRVYNAATGGTIDMGAFEFQDLLDPVLSDFDNISKTYGDADFSLTAPNSTSSGTISYSSDNSDVATVSGNTVTIVGAGTANIKASQASNADFRAGEISLELTVDKAVLSVAAAAKTKVYGDIDPALTYSASGFKLTDDEDIITGALARDAGENVGLYAINQGTLDAGSNYDIDYTADDLTITKVTLSVVAAAKTKVYGDTDPALTYAATGFKLTDDEDIITGALSRDAGENVGLYAINQGTLDAGGNYDIDYTADELTITKATLQVTAAAKTKVYGETDPTLTYSATGFKLTDDEDIITGALSRDAGENVGQYAINQGTLDAGSNYDIDYTADDLTITKATLSVVAATKTKAYGDTDPALTYSASGFKLTDDEDIITGALSRDAGENVGQYAINQGTLDAGGNYDIDYTANDLTITKVTLSVVAAVKTKVYGDADPALTYSATGFKLTDDEDIITGALARDAGENIGQYAINQGTLDAGGNYDIDYTADELTITKATLQVTAAAKTKVYGDTDPALTYSATGFKLTDDEDIITGALSRNPGENVGAYTINQGTLDAGDNYDIDYTSDELTITKATLQVTAEAKTKVYGDADPAFTYVATGFKLTDDEGILAGALSRNPGENVGTYTINQGTLDAGSNYEIDYTADELTITKATLQVTAAAKTKAYGDADPALTHSATGFKLTDGESIITGTLNRDAGEAVGTYAINQGTLYAGGNYEIEYIANEFTITKATLNVVAAAKTKVYGDADPALSYSASGFKFNDGSNLLTGGLEREAGEAAGTYSINQGTLSVSGNYDIHYVANELTITKATLQVAAEAKTKVYGGADPALTYSATGFKLNDGASIITGAINRAAGENAGTYAINQGTLSAGGNYELHYTGAEFTITKATLNVTAQAKTKVYGDADPLLTYLATGFKLNDGSSIITGTLARASGQDAGVYAINLGTLSAGGNYDIHYTGAEFTITKATQTISFQLPATLYRNDGSINLNATTSSGLAVYFSLDDPQVAFLNGYILTPLRIGVINVTATQPGSNNYHAAEPVTVSVEILSEDPTRTAIRVHPALSPNGDGINDFLLIEGIKQYPENQVIIFNGSDKILETIKGYNNQDKVFTGQKYPNGTYYYLVEYKDGNEWKREKGFFIIRK